MANLKHSQIRAIEEAVAYPRGFGYVLDFSDTTFWEFFEDEFGVDISDEKYMANGTSKRNKLTSFIKIEEPPIVAKVLRTLWKRREDLIRDGIGSINPSGEEKTKKIYFESISAIEGIAPTPRTDALEKNSDDRMLNELAADIERDILAQKPEAAMDHLHTYCMRKITHLLKNRGIECTRNEPLHSRFGKYRSALAKERNLTGFTDRALKSAIGLFEGYNDVRNNNSFAHDNVILKPAEARYVFDIISAILVFVQGIESET